MYIKLKNISGNKSYSLCTPLKKETVNYISKENNLDIVFKEPSKRKMNKGGKKNIGKMYKKNKGKVKKKRKEQRRKKLAN